MAINDIISEIDTNKLINDLQRLIKISSVSARKQNLEECANEIVKIMREIGIFEELIYLRQRSSWKSLGLVGALLAKILKFVNSL